jgi:SAM-dependent methyltransferase
MDGDGIDLLDILLTKFRGCVTMNLESLQNAQIARAQERLIKKLMQQKYVAKVATWPLYSSITRWILPANGNRILELGCGPGKFVAMLARLGFDVTGVDPLNFPTWEVIKEYGIVKLIDGISAESLPFEKNSFDQAVCLGAILYFDDPEKGLRELRRVVKPGGRVVVRNPNRLNSYTVRTGRNLDPASQWLFSPQELGELLERNGFSVEASFTHGVWPSRHPDLWWYVDQVWLPNWLRDFLSNLTPPDRRLNITVFATAR